MPEVLWRAYIDFEVSEAEFGRARSLYERLLHRSSHVKVWVSYALFELEYGGSASGAAGGGSGANGGEGEASGTGAAAGGDIVAARAVFNKG